MARAQNQGHFPTELYHGEMSRSGCKSFRLNRSMNWRLILISLSAILCTYAPGQSSLDDVHVTPRRPKGSTVDRNTPGRATSSAVSAVIKKDVDLVLLPVSVTDGLERLVTGLGQNNFQLCEGEKQQEIKHFSREDTPLCIWA
ncbi:MAG: hypothetical protein WB660_20275 [Candidatus Sulfotelmatobacter sp.]